MRTGGKMKSRRKFQCGDKLKCLTIVFPHVRGTANAENSEGHRIKVIGDEYVIIGFAQVTQ